MGGKGWMVVRFLEIIQTIEQDHCLAKPLWKLIPFPNTSPMTMANACGAYFQAHYRCCLYHIIYLIFKTTLEGRHYYFPPILQTRKLIPETLISPKSHVFSGA